MENNGLSNSVPTEAELQALFEAGNKNVLTGGGNESELRKLLTPKDEAATPTAEEEDTPPQEEEEESTERSDENNEEVEEDSQEESEHSEELPEPRQSKTAQPVNKQQNNKQRDGGKPEKKPDTKKPSVFDEARTVLDKLPEDQRKSVAKLLNHAANLDRRKTELDQKLRSDDGRVSAMQRTIDELRNQVAFLKSQPPVNKPASDGAKAAKVVTRGEIKSYIESDPDLKELHENDPAQAELLAKQALTLEAKTEAKLQATRKSQEETLDQRYLQTQGQMIREAFPNIDEILDMPEFKAWIGSAPRFIKEQLNSPHGDAVIDVLNRFHYDLDAYKKWASEQNEEQSNEEEEETPPAPRQSNRADQVAQQRRQRARSNAAAPSAAPTNRKGPEPSLEELFNQGYERKRKEIYGG